MANVLKVEKVWWNMKKTWDSFLEFEKMWESVYKEVCKSELKVEKVYEKVYKV